MAKENEKRNRVFSTLKGQATDRAPVSAWGHLIPDELDVGKLAQSTLANFRFFDWDWLKVNPRATYFAEAWGWEYDFGEYHGVQPKLKHRPVEPFDPEKLKSASISAPVWRDHLHLLKLIKEGIGGAPFVQTIFSPLSVLGFLSSKPGIYPQEAVAQDRLDSLLTSIRKEPRKAHAALEVITGSLEKLAAASVDAGADGIFFAITRFAREGALTAGEFLEFGKPYDLRVLAAVGGAEFNIFHNCGPRVHWKETADYPVHAINWASVGQDNPDISTAKSGIKQAVIGGIDENGVLRHGTPKQVLDAARSALALAGPGRFFLAPGCSVDPSVPRENLRALREAVEN